MFQLNTNNRIVACSSFVCKLSACVILTPAFAEKFWLLHNAWQTRGFEKSQNLLCLFSPLTGKGGNAKFDSLSTFTQRRTEYLHMPPLSWCFFQRSAWPLCLGFLHSTSVWIAVWLLAQIDQARSSHLSRCASGTLNLPQKLTSPERSITLSFLLFATRHQKKTENPLTDDSAGSRHHTNPMTL